MRQDHGAEEKDGFLDQGVGVSKHDIISWMSITGTRRVKGQKGKCVAIGVGKNMLLY